jgi:hypothetical protein
MTAPERKRPPVARPAGAAHDLHQAGEINTEDNGATAADPDARPQAKVPRYLDGYSKESIYRVRWWRPGWQAGKRGANSRYFVQTYSVDKFVHKLRTSPPNDFGPLHVEVTWCSRGPWLGGES